jgi:hypothetical protein
MALRKAVDEMAQGLIDANLGGNIVKKRIALPGRGKRGSARTLIATNRGSRWFFIFGFEKNERQNISSTELKALQEIGRELLDSTANSLDDAVLKGLLEEIFDDQKK